MISSSPKLQEEALRAARAFLLGTSTPGTEKRPVTAGPSPELSPSAPPGSLPSQPREPHVELSAPDIRRTGSGWRARCIHAHGIDVRHVTDARHGGYVGSFIAALDVRDRFYRERAIPIPWQIEAIVDGERVAPEVVTGKRSIVVRWQGQEHVVTGDDAEEIATEIALDLFVELLDDLRAFK